MPAVAKRQNSDHMCGLSFWHPAWIQKYATTKTFMGVYGLLGTIQAMSYMYFVVTLTTIEKRFKIPSQTTGIILSGNEISQILLSLLLSYVGGQRNRPRWIAWGIVFSGMSCFILATPHFIYGAGEDALQLTKEYYNGTDLANVSSSTASLIKNSQRLCGSILAEDQCEALISIVPLVLIFLSQFVLGIGNTLYFALGQTYLDDNTKKTNTPLMLAMAMSLRMSGPIIGFLLGFVSLNMFIDPRKTPLIDNKDPRWLGAWWFGWTILGTLLVLFSVLIGLFPKVLPKKRKQTLSKYNSHEPQVLKHEDLQMDESLPLRSGYSSNVALDTPAAAASDLPTLKDFPTALMRLLKNKVLIFNIMAGVFYILGASGYMTFLTRYMEVQFHKNAQSATVVVGPLSIIGMVAGMMGSGIFISKKKPSARALLMWNTIVGLIYICGQISYSQMHCGDSSTMLVNGKLNLTATCNANCNCENVKYTPVCHEESGTTFFSACHAGCQNYDADEKFYSNCSCAAATDLFTSTISPIPFAQATNFYESTSTAAYLPLVEPEEDLLTRARRSLDSLTDQLTPGVCLQGCNAAFWGFSITSMIVNWLGSSGRIGTLLINYRAVAPEDKSFAQGLALMLISLLALIPGPIIFGRAIDSTCLLWAKTCSGNGNCQLYDQTKFRYYVNGMAMCFTSFAVVCDVVVWFYSKNIDLYGEAEAKQLEELKRKNKPISPLMARK